jgi:hypothetical protein
MTNFSELRVFLCMTPTSMSFSFDRLMGIAERTFNQDPLSGHLFLFVNRYQNRIKILFWDRDGFCIWYKRLERGVFEMPAKGQAGVLMIQRKDGKFVPSDTALFAMQPLSEETDAVFFDANGDGFPDLYVVSGGNEPQQNGSKLLEDRLYINDRKGHFKEKKDFTIQSLDNKSCVTVDDIDHDGGTGSKRSGCRQGRGMRQFRRL